MMDSTPRFDDDIETAAEMLRRAVPQMVQRRIPVDPLNYALWYGYVSGRDPALIQTVEASLAGEDSYSRELVEKLVYRHVLRPRSADAEAANDTAIGILVELLSRIGASSEGAERYGRALEEGLATLRGTQDTVQIRDTLENLLEQTREARGQQARFEAELCSAQREIETLRSELARAEELSRVDPLTGIGNRRHVEEAAARLLLPGASVALLLLDVDHFKRVNDTWGHAVGDAVLQRVAGILRRHACEVIEVARVGGEEFALLVPGQREGLEPVRVAERIRREIAGIHLSDPASGAVLPPLSASLGVALRRDDEDADSMYRRADTALYAAK
ncbi:MAG: GGDEF domain-containing protein, partial [Gammaproteobacteria bacterium]